MAYFQSALMLHALRQWTSQRAYRHEHVRPCLVPLKITYSAQSQHSQAHADNAKGLVYIPCMAKKLHVPLMASIMCYY